MSQTLDIALQLIPLELLNTLFMVFASAIIATIIGLPLGVFLMLTSKGQLFENKKIYEMIAFFVNIGRSFPFAILIVALLPLTRVIMGTTLGTKASIVPLTIAAIPFVARMVELSLLEINKSVIEAAVVMGSSKLDLVKKVLIPESLASLVLSFTNLIINLIGLSAMAGLMGGGGLGKIAIQYGYYQFNVPLMIITVLVLIILVQIVQIIGNKIAKNINIKRGKISS